MPVAPPKMDEADLLDRMALVMQAFRPAAPIDRRSLFAGRSDQIADVFSVVAQPGQHAVIYGERGVGKTSLAGVTAEMLAGADVLTARATCNAGDDFASVWRQALERDRHSLGIAGARLRAIARTLRAGPRQISSARAQ